MPYYSNRRILRARGTARRHRANRLIRLLAYELLRDAGLPFTPARLRRAMALIRNHMARNPNAYYRSRH